MGAAVVGASRRHWNCSPERGSARCGGGRLLHMAKGLVYRTPEHWNVEVAAHGSKGIVAASRHWTLGLC
eukprot:1523795-Alexandrium_andersonii.AAC.1